MALRYRIEQVNKFARTLRRHKPEQLNWIRARGRSAAGATDGSNGKAQVTTRKAHGSRTYEQATIALYPALENLPKPDWLTHKFV